MESAGEWLERALNDLCIRMETGLALDADMISGLVSYCEFAPPEDAKEYLDSLYEPQMPDRLNIIGEEAAGSVIQEYLKRRGYTKPGNSSVTSTSKLHTYVKPPMDEAYIGGTKKPSNVQNVASGSSSVQNNANGASVEHKESGNGQAKNQGGSKKKKTGNVISLAEAAKGSIVFKQGLPCSCQARRHRLVSNCLSCGKIVCEQEGEGPCNFCGSLVLKEGSTYAGLDGSLPTPSSDAEVAAEAYAKRLVEYDRNSAARTKVIDDQSDYYDEGNKWLSMEEKELLKKKQEDLKEAEEAKRKKVVVAFDLVGRKVMFNEDDIHKLDSENSILRPPDEREVQRVKPNPTLKIKPIFINPGPSQKSEKKGKPLNKGLSRGLCLEISGRVQHDASLGSVSHMVDDAECSAA
ncbi:hypothetical protein V2J09_011353 [Rumex salicifolius]